MENPYMPNPGFAKLSRNDCPPGRLAPMAADQPLASQFVVSPYKVSNTYFDPARAMKPPAPEMNSPMTALLLLADVSVVQQFFRPAARFERQTAASPWKMSKPFGE